MIKKNKKWSCASNPAKANLAHLAASIICLALCNVKPASGAIFRVASQVPHFQICFSGAPFSDLLLRYPSARFASQVPDF